MEYRIEKDTMGEVKVPADKLWGAQTERSRNNFKIGAPASMPKEVIYGFAYLKKAAAYANFELGVLSQEKRDLIAKVCDEILEGKLDDQFPLVIWQTGSGTQSNMNVNEVIANRAQLLAGRKIGEGEKVLQPNDDVNKSQSSNDTFPTGMHIAAYKMVVETTIPTEKIRGFQRCGKNRTYPPYGRHSPYPRSGVLWLCIPNRTWYQSSEKYPCTPKRIGLGWYCCRYRYQYA